LRVFSDITRVNAGHSARCFASFFGTIHSRTESANCRQWSNRRARFNCKVVLERLSSRVHLSPRGQEQDGEVQQRWLGRDQAQSNRLQSALVRQHPMFEHKCKKILKIIFFCKRNKKILFLQDKIFFFCKKNIFVQKIIFAFPDAVPREEERRILHRTWTTGNFLVHGNAQPSSISANIKKNVPNYREH
jgi:hypothetical protein